MLPFSDFLVYASPFFSLTALAREVNGNTKLSAPVTVNVANVNHFQNEILATGLNLPTVIKFLPDGRMLVVEFSEQRVERPSTRNQS